jgi:hypothetical protein
VNASVLTISTDSACLLSPMNSAPLALGPYRCVECRWSGNPAISSGGSAERGHKEDAAAGRHPPEEL